jgi:hypothetical protein
MITTTEISEYKKQLSQLIEKISGLAFHSAYADPLIQGCPGKVFRRCGIKTCKCAGSLAERHGPYLVIQVYQGKKQKQLTLKKGQEEVWQKAKHYQKQTKYYLELKETCSDLLKKVSEILDKRIEKWPPEHSEK